MDTRSDTGFGYSMRMSIQSFSIGVVESVKKLKSMAFCENVITSLTGLPGMSIRSKEGSAETRVKLGRHVSSSGYDKADWSESPENLMSVRFG